MPISALSTNCLVTLSLLSKFRILKGMNTQLAFEVFQILVAMRVHALEYAFRCPSDDTRGKPSKSIEISFFDL